MLQAATIRPMPDFPAAHAILLDAIRDHAFPGTAYGVLLRGRVLAISSAGNFTYDQSSPAVRPDTVFDIASVSKVMATTAAAMLLWERGQLDLDEPISKRLPEFVSGEPEDSPKRAITPRMLLAHSSGLPAYERFYERFHTPKALLQAALRVPLEAAPETRAVYSDIGFIVLGHYLERLTGERLDAYCQHEIFSPLEMQSTRFCPPEDERTAIPPTRLHDPLRSGIVQGEVHDDNCWVLGGVGGHAGVFSNVEDVLGFAGCMLAGGKPLFARETVAYFTARQERPAGTSRALGWDMPSQPSSSGKYFSSHSVGHLGYTGTSLWIDFERELAVVLLTNRTFPGDGLEGVSTKIQQVRPAFHDALLKDLGTASSSRIPFTEQEIAAYTVGKLQPLAAKVRLVDYDPEWPNMFSREASRIHVALGSRALKIEHVGSTAVPGIAAKPTIDMLLVVANSADEESYVTPLQSIGYTLHVREPHWHEHRMFRDTGAEVNLHVFSSGCPEIDRMLTFRDWLRNHPSDRELYLRAKWALAEKEWKYMQNYADAKTEIIEEIMKRAGFHSR